ncbi:MAG: DUF4124 domain-containing protein [Gammaproteobacteria bacterium]|nr:DUF4124 domain-containing protein [Gammaproteobacteria bacterium]
MRTSTVVMGKVKGKVKVRDKGNNLVVCLGENVLASATATSAAARSAAATFVAAVSATLIIAALLLPSAATAAQIYKHTDENGNVVFTDVPPRQGASAETVEVQVTAPNSFETPEALRVDPNAWIVDPADAEAEIAAFSYQYSRITSPADDASVRENAGNVTLTAEIVPSLRTGDQLHLVIDSTLQQVTRSPHFNLTNVDRGTHVARVDVVDAAGKVLLSGQPSTFHLQRFAGGDPRRPVQPIAPPAPTPPPSRPNPVRSGN